MALETNIATTSRLANPLAAVLGIDDRVAERHALVATRCVVDDHADDPSVDRGFVSPAVRDALLLAHRRCPSRARRSGALIMQRELFSPLECTLARRAS